MNNPLHVRVLDRLADGDGELQPLLGSQFSDITEFGDRGSLDELHDEIRTTVWRSAGVEDLGNVRMVHDRKRLALGLEPAQHAAGIHTRLDELERHPALDRIQLVGDPDLAHAPLTNLFEQLVTSGDDGSSAFGGPAKIGGLELFRPGWLEKLPRFRVSLQQSLDLPPKVGLVTASFVQIGSAFRGALFFQGAQEDFFDAR